MSEYKTASGAIGPSWADPSNPNRGAKGDAFGFFTGFDALNDINQGRFGVQDQFDPNAYLTDPNAGSFTINDGSYTAAIAQAMAAAQGRATPQASYADMGQSNEARGNMMQLGQTLQNRIAGNAPSVAEMQMRQGLDATIAAQRAQAASARGLSPGMAQRLAAQGIAGAQQATNQQAAILRAQEQQQAEGAYAGLMGNVRQGDLGAAGMQQQVNLANQATEMQNRQQMDEMMRNMISQGMSAEQARTQAQIEMEKLKAQQQQTAATLAQKTSDANAKRAQEAKGGIIQGIGGMISSIKSDERLKENIAPADKDLRGFLDKLNAYTFDYKSPEHGGKDNLGVMAQDVEKSKLGKSIVEDLPDGKALDIKRLVSALTAAAGHLNKRVAALEGAR